MATSKRAIDAIEMLKAQHVEVADLFEEYEEAEKGDEKQAIFEEIADKLAVHATIEEKHFYPAVKAKRTEDILLESLEEHLAIKRVIADLLKMDPSDDKYDAKVTVLREEVEHHVEEEQTDLFPKVKKLLDRPTLEALAQEMTATQEALLEEGDPRDAVPGETSKSAEI
jgi:hemerythrin superfamily protein